MINKEKKTQLTKSFKPKKSQFLPLPKTTSPSMSVLKTNRTKFASRQKKPNLATGSTENFPN